MRLLTFICGILFSSFVFAIGTVPISNPTLTFERIIITNPFNGSSEVAGDSEGSAIIPGGLFYIADDNDNAIHIVNPTTGVYSSKITENFFQNSLNFQNGQVAGLDRSGDLEGLAYNEVADTMIASSGNAGPASAEPTMFRLTRQSGVLKVESWQDLGSTDNFGAMAWRPIGSFFHIAQNKTFRTYDYLTNTKGAPITINALPGNVLGMDFVNGGNDLLVVTSQERLVLINWINKTIRWNLPLVGFSINDSRAVVATSLGGANKVLVSEGMDGESGVESHAVYVFGIQ